MLCKPLLPKSHPDHFCNASWKHNNKRKRNLNTNDNTTATDKFSGASHPALKLKSGTNSVPEKSFKTTESPEHKNITPDKDHDVTMKESDEGGSGGNPPKLEGEDEVMDTSTGNDMVTSMEVDRKAEGGGDVSGSEGKVSDRDSNNNGSEGDSKMAGGNGEVSEKSAVKDEKDTGGSGEATSSAAISGGNEEKSGENDQDVIAPAASLPLLVGTLTYSDAGDVRRHFIHGNWSFEDAPDPNPQRFELTRNLAPEEDLKELPKDGEFHGSFSLQYKKGKTKTKTRVVAENGVKMAFVKLEGELGSYYSVKGQGNNEYGTFELNGTAIKSTDEDDPSYNVRLHKNYITTAPVAQPVSEKKSKDKKRKFAGIDSSAVDEADQELPPPAKSYPTAVVCLRGKLVRHTSPNLGFTDVVHKITGLWGTGLDQILADPDNTKGLCNTFQYEHKCSNEKDSFPLSGKYTGWFYLKNELTGENTKIPERDILLKFRENSEGYHNVEGKGMNAFGKYSITGTLTTEGVITIFRHFQAIKPKKSTSVKISTPAPGPLNGNGDYKSPLPVEDLGPPLLSFDDVKIPDGSEPVLIATAPEQYSAISRGILKVNDDGAHTCTGSWAVTNDHFSNGATSEYHFGIEAHRAAEDAQVMLDRMKASGADREDDRQISGIVGDGATPVSLANTTFPIDSAQYKGSFKMRRSTTKFQSIVDKQIVLKFVKNTSGSYNIYGKGVNSIGIFDLVGTLILQGKNNGIIQLYRIYPLVQPAEPEPISKPVARQTGKVFPGSLTEKVSGDSGPVPAMDPPEKYPPSLSTLRRRESSRQTKVPSRLEDDDPEAQLERLMEKCAEILKELHIKDTYNFFNTPVDPVAQGVPTYFQVIKNPMDLGTIQTKMDAEEIDSPEEFARLVRLVFENAITFNTSDNIVNQAARNLLIIFNEKFRQVERIIEAAKKSKKLTKAERLELKRRKEKDAAKDAKRKSKDGKRKPTDEGTNAPKRMRVEDFVAANKSALDAIAAAVPQDPAASSQVSRTEFNLLLQMVGQMQEHIVAVHTLLSNSTNSNAAALFAGSSMASSHMIETHKSTANGKKKKKPQKSAKTEEVKKEEEPEKEVEQSPSPSHRPSPDQAPAEDLQSLTFEEQEALSDAINRLPERLLPGAMQIIREADFVNEDDEEIDLDIDQLDTRTQRRLQHFVMEVRFLEAFFILQVFPCVILVV